MADIVDIALVQLTTPADAVAAFDHASPLIEEAARTAKFILLPECANLVEQRRELKAGKVVAESEDYFVRGVRELAMDLQVEILVGSVIVKAENSD